jgi:hypothetical protein
MERDSSFPLLQNLIPLPFPGLGLSTIVSPLRIYANFLSLAFF